MRSFLSTAALLASAATAVNAITLSINNWSGSDNYVWVDGASSPQVLKAHAITSFTLQSGGDHVLKMSTTTAGNPVYSNNIMQFEYSIDGKFAWDLSMINGNPFGSGNVKVSPTGTGVNDASFPTCKQLKCNANQVCEGAYQASDAINVSGKTRTCPTNTGTIWLDLWEPVNNYNSRDLHFSA